MRFPFRQTVTIARYIGRQKKADVKRFPLVLMLEPLHACNLTCTGCGRIREYRDTIKEIVPLERCLAAIDECNAPVVSICGGEPLLYPQIGELVEQTLKRGRVVYLCTNGQVLKKKLSIFRPHPFFNINVHIDGPEKTHDAVVERPGAYAKAIDAIRAALAEGFTVCTNTTVYKQTSVEDIASLVGELDRMGVNGILLSPSYGYADVDDQSVFLTRTEIIEKFRRLRPVGKGRRIWSTPLYLDFLSGNRSFTCTPWGNVTYNIKGWKAPCYLMTDRHFETFADFMERVDWKRYGPGRDPRCEHCMVHSGFEATVALEAGSSVKDAIRMARWTLL
jgi:hopanoid biosynthesis associated radical SAM protein HpnH